MNCSLNRKHIVFSNIEQIRTCSYLRNQTRTLPYFCLQLCHIQTCMYIYLPIWGNTILPLHIISIFDEDCSKSLKMKKHWCEMLRSCSEKVHNCVGGFQTSFVSMAVSSWLNSSGENLTQEIDDISKSTQYQMISENSHNYVINCRMSLFINIRCEVGKCC